MKPKIEKEYKTMISADQYDFIRQYLPLEERTQTNYYYRSSNPQVALRIREIDRRFTFTLKERNGKNKNEYEFPVRKRNLDDPQIQELLKKFQLEDPVLLGSSTTIRSTLEMHYGQFCLDQSTYFGKTDYEIEYEFYQYNEGDGQEFFELLELLNVSYIPSPKSKYARFLEAKK